MVFFLGSKLSVKKIGYFKVWSLLSIEKMFLL